MKSICDAEMACWPPLRSLPAIRKPPLPTHTLPHPPPPLPVSLFIPVPKWMPGATRKWQGGAQLLRLLSNVTPEREGARGRRKKIFNGLSVAFPALTCQVIRNLSFSLVSPSPRPPPPPQPQGPRHTTNYLLYQSQRREEAGK